MSIAAWTTLRLPCPYIMAGHFPTHEDDGRCKSSGSGLQLALQCLQVGPHSAVLICHTQGSQTGLQGMLLLQKRRAGSIRDPTIPACVWQVILLCAPSHSRLQALQGIALVGDSLSPGYDSLLPPISPDHVQLCAGERAGARHSAADRAPCCAGALTAACRRCGRLTRAGCLSCAAPAREATAAC